MGPLLARASSVKSTDWSLAKYVVSWILSFIRDIWSKGSNIATFLELHIIVVPFVFPTVVQPVNLKGIQIGRVWRRGDHLRYPDIWTEVRESYLFLQWEYTKPLSLAPSCLREASVAVSSLWGAISMTQNRMGSWVWRVIGLGSGRTSISKKMQ